jgi:aldehyde dehydrogenase (NAD+)
VWGGDAERALQAASRIESGTVWVNVHGVVNRRAPFGSVKQSGIGVRGGLEGIPDYTPAQTITVPDA